MTSLVRIASGAHSAGKSDQLAVHPEASAIQPPGSAGLFNPVTLRPQAESGHRQPVPIQIPDCCCCCGNVQGVIENTVPPPYWPPA
jgi:hypothetical protein